MIAQCFLQNFSKIWYNNKEKNIYIPQGPHVQFHQK